jgi:hypothetical protein
MQAIVRTLARSHDELRRTCKIWACAMVPRFFGVLNYRRTPTNLQNLSLCDGSSFLRCPELPTNCEALAPNQGSFSGILWCSQSGGDYLETNLAKIWLHFNYIKKTRNKTEYILLYFCLPTITYQINKFGDLECVSFQIWGGFLGHFFPWKINWMGRIFLGQII